MAEITWDPSLIARYNINGPRYTSYPTALALTSPFDHSHLLQALEASNDTLSLYIHLPFCHQLCYYCGCNKIVTRHQSKADSYLDALEQEMQLYKTRLTTRTIGHVHLGGGTPTFLTEAQLSRLMQMLNTHFGIVPSDTHETSIEIDPRSCSLAKLEHLRNLGFNRVSYGIQDFDNDVQIAINRVQDYEMVAALIKRSRELGFASINLDVIYGLPHQNPTTFQESLDKVVALNPDRISLFSYAHLPSRFAAQRKIKDATLPNPELKLQLMQMGIQTFTQAGYQFIGMDHFARPTDELAKAQRAGKLQRNFQGYTTHGSGALLGLGNSSISQVHGVIWQNEKALAEYYGALSENKLPVCKGVLLTHDDEIRANLIAELICHFHLDINAFAQKWQLNFHDYFATSLPRLQNFIADGLVNITDKEIRITDNGRLWVRSICSAFDAYLADGQQSYSKVV
ncbi:oxygen-independent coproporphyrinogen III oxidase [Aliidiomarina shirensis]|uniref:Coproporphyrinogen-III oxidase n=1 Tax=Aliidiomarina shirensis TaxID=1048642 RepID=A0A432WQE1_9GAMM|nr:oxygen-independent coproporphyrinogen III oxidase [Aliidiomarina shirensis]RUO36022.1 oxygen-independent coproporphyrinogen III oxidase [Aliidiomarina shirensis]